MKKNKAANYLVSVIIPTKNSSEFLSNCLSSIRQQTYPNIELIIVDGGSIDKTLEICKKYGAKVFTYKPNVAKGVFDAPHKRNYGVGKAKGKLVYYVDADMELPKKLISEAVGLCSNKYDALILPEDSFGIGIWASAKNLERRCYWGDDSVEAPRFFKKSVWKNVGGLDVSIGGGGDDWDLYQKVLDRGYKVGRTKNIVMHNEGNLKLLKLMKKRFMYGRETAKYIKKRPKAAAASYFPIRMSYIRNWKMFLSRPADSVVFVIMRFCEYLSGGAGILYSMFK